MSDKLPIYEIGLEEVVKACRGRNLFFSTDVHKHGGKADIFFVRCDTRPAQHSLWCISANPVAMYCSGQGLQPAGANWQQSGLGCLLSCCV